MKHSPAETCERCEEMLKSADPVIGKWFRKIKWKFHDAHLSCTFRGKAEQDEAFRTGASKLVWPKSKHNVMKVGVPTAAAMDLFCLSDYGAPSWDWRFFNRIALYLKAENAPIDWGWDLWQWDSPHFQMREPKQIVSKEKPVSVPPSEAKAS